MPEESQRDIEEIFLHVKQIKEEQDKLENKREDELDSIEIIQDNTGQTVEETNLDNIPPEDVFEIVGSADEPSDETGEFLEETVSKMEVDIDSTVTCDLCKREIVFEENLSGLVIHDRFFACEECCQVVSKDELLNWAKSKMAKLGDVRPIALWLMQEKDRTKLSDR